MTSLLPTIRLFEDRDLQALAGLCEELGYPVGFEALKANISKIRSTPNHKVYVAVISNQVVGYVYIREEISLSSPPRAEIGGLVVSSSYRNKGVGAALMKAAEEWSQSNGFKQVSLSSQTKREKAHEFYKNIGYEIKKHSYFLGKELTKEYP
jgi:GNAT superfamily N-acetyltransferase